MESFNIRTLRLAVWSVFLLLTVEYPYIGSTPDNQSFVSTLPTNGGEIKSTITTIHLTVSTSSPLSDHTSTALPAKTQEPHTTTTTTTNSTKLPSTNTTQFSTSSKDIHTLPPPTAPGESSIPGASSTKGTRTTITPPTAPGESSIPGASSTKGTRTTITPPTAPGESSIPGASSTKGTRTTISPPTAPGESSIPGASSTKGTRTTITPPTAPGESSIPGASSTKGTRTTISPPTAPGESFTPGASSTKGTRTTISPPTAPGESSTPGASSTKGTRSNITWPITSTLPTNSYSSPTVPIPGGTTTVTSTVTKQPCRTSSSTNNVTAPSRPWVPECVRSQGVVSLCLIGIAALAAVLVIFVMSTVVLSTKLSSRKYRFDRGRQPGTEMVCISSVMTGRNDRNGGGGHANLEACRTLLTGPEDSDEDSGGNLTLNSFLPDGDRMV